MFDQISIESPLISIVMAYYNRYPQLVTTLDVIALSTYKKIEVIIVDDCSMDGAPIDLLSDLYAFPIKILHMRPRLKTYTNSCVPFNCGLDLVSGTITVLQNPEVCYAGDVLRHIATHLGPTDYYSYGCVPLPTYDLNWYVRSLLTREYPISPGALSPSGALSPPDPNDYSLDVHPDPNDYSLGMPLAAILEYIHNYPVKAIVPWYNDPLKPTYFHFCAATFTSNIKKARGFSLEYKDGRCFDDDDLVFKMRSILKLNMVTPPASECFVIHQYHKPSPAVNCLSFDADDPILKGYLRNQAILAKKKADLAMTPLRSTIPKIFHGYWDGSPMSFLNYMTVRTFHYYNPDYEIIVWVPSVRTKNNTWLEYVHRIPYTGIDYWSMLQAESFVQIKYIDLAAIGFRNDASEVIKSDFLRLWLLSEYGGLWSDMDIFYVRPLCEMVTTNRPDFDTLLVYDVQYFDKQDNNIKAPHVLDPDTMQAVWYFPVAFFMATKGNKFFTDMCNTAKSYYDPLTYQCLGVKMFEKKFGIGEEAPSRIRDAYPELSISIHNHEIYLPILWYETERLFKHPDTPIPQASVGIHLFGGSNLYKQYCNDPTSSTNNSCISTLINKFLALEAKHTLSTPIVNLNDYRNVVV